MPVDGVLDCTAVNQLTFRDLLLVQRFINYVRHCFNNELRRRFVAERTLVVNSLVPVFTEPALREALGMMLDEHKVAAAIQLLTWNSLSQTVFDVMYQPVIASH
jgi:hypothetical protein